MQNLAQTFEKHIPITQANVITVNILSETTNLSKQQIKLAMQKGAVWLTRGKNTQRLRRAKKVLMINDILHIYYDPNLLSQAPPQPILISDEGAYSIWNKPYGMLSQGSKWSDHCTITRWAEQHLTPQRVSFIVHRLDRAANGLILVAHEKNAAVAFSKLFQERKIEKRYQILVHGKFDETSTKETPITVNSDIDDRSATSHFNLINYDASHNRSLLDVSIETGRKHQIRRHSALLGFPVVGDRLHGTKSDKEDLQLCAYYLAFTCPYTNEKKQFSLKI